MHGISNECVGQTEADAIQWTGSGNTYVSKANSPKVLHSRLQTRLKNLKAPHQVRWSRKEQSSSLSRRLNGFH